jgi:cholesterol transport system auxiliary component
MRTLMDKTGRTQRRLFLIGAASLTLSACGADLLGPPEAGPLYPLRPAFPAAAAGEKVNWALSIMRPDVPGGLDTDRIALLQTDGTMDYYAKATYPDRLPAIIQRTVIEGFEASGRIGAIARAQDALHADYNLLVEVKDFQAVYKVADGLPQAVVAISAKLTTAHGRKIIGSLAVSKSVDAGANSTGAATQALSQALGQAVSEIVVWTLATAPAIVPGQSPESSTASPGRELLKDVTRGSEGLRQSTTPAPQ